MKTLKTLILLILAVTGLAFAASAPSVTEALVRIQSDPPTGQVTAFFEKTVAVEGVEYKQPWTSVSWAIGSSKTVTVNGKTYTYAEVLAAVLAIAAQEKVDQAAEAAAAAAAAQQGGGQ